jgi:hypothetical protein
MDLETAEPGPSKVIRFFKLLKPVFTSELPESDWRNMISEEGQLEDGGDLEPELPERPEEPERNEALQNDAAWQRVLKTYDSEVRIWEKDLERAKNAREKFHKDRVRMIGYIKGQLSETSVEAVLKTDMGKEGLSEEDPRKLLVAIYESHSSTQQATQDVQERLDEAKKRRGALKQMPGTSIHDYIQRFEQEDMFFNIAVAARFGEETEEQRRESESERARACAMGLDESRFRGLLSDYQTKSSWPETFADLEKQAVKWETNPWKVSSGGYRQGHPLYMAEAHGGGQGYGGGQSGRGFGGNGGHGHGGRGNGGRGYGARGGGQYGRGRGDWGRGRGDWGRGRGGGGGGDEILCSRCGRNNHLRRDCVARTTFDGAPLQPRVNAQNGQNGGEQVAEVVASVRNGAAGGGAGRGASAAGGGAGGGPGRGAVPGNR